MPTHYRPDKPKSLRVWLVDGQYYNDKQIAERLGLSLDGMRRRLKREQKKNQPLTWAGLRTVYGYTPKD